MKFQKKPKFLSAWIIRQPKVNKFSKCDKNLDQRKFKADLFLAGRVINPLESNET